MAKNIFRDFEVKKLNGDMVLTLAKTFEPAAAAEGVEAAPVPEGLRISKTKRKNLNGNGNLKKSSSLPTLTGKPTKLSKTQKRPLLKKQSGRWMFRRSMHKKPANKPKRS